MKISVVMCVKNSMPYILASIKSFNNQTYKNKELIIVYSKSNDQTFNFLKNLKNKNIKIVQFNGNIYQSLNHGIKFAKGKLIGILHSDDIFFEDETLDKICSAYNFENKIDLIYGNVLYSERDNLLNIKRIWKQSKLNNIYDLPPHTGTFISKKILKKLKYSEKYLISGDTDLLLRIFSKEVKYTYINKFISIMREGGISTNYRYIINKSMEDVKIFSSHNLSFFDYIKKISGKFNQLFVRDKIKISKSIINLNNESKGKFYDFKQFNKYNGKIISALNLAFIAYDYKFKIRSHNTLFWSDGFISEITSKKKKIPGRIFLKKFIKKINSFPYKYKNIYVLGRLPLKSNRWLSYNLNSKFIHYNLPYGNTNKINKFLVKLNISDNSLIILTLPTPKQELVANFINLKFPKSTILCIGGSINISSQYEKEAPKIFYNLNLEWLWRLKFDTRRRITRLIETMILYIQAKLTGKTKIY